MGKAIQQVEVALERLDVFEERLREEGPEKGATKVARRAAGDRQDRWPPAGFD